MKKVVSCRQEVSRLQLQLENQVAAAEANERFLRSLLDELERRALRAEAKCIALRNQISSMKDERFVMNATEPDRLIPEPAIEVDVVCDCDEVTE